LPNVKPGNDVLARIRADPLEIPGLAKSKKRVLNVGLDGHRVDQPK